MKKLLSIRREEIKDLIAAGLIVSLVFSSFLIVGQVYAASVTLTATVATSLSFTTTTNQFPTVTPGTITYATTTLDVATNDTSGWFTTLSGDNKSTGNNNLQLAGNATVQIPDQTEWIPGVATTSAGNAVIRASMTNSGDQLAFRVMTASSSNGTAFISTNWWGATDVDGTALWAGIASSTVARQIGNAGTGSYLSLHHLNSVIYYLNVAATQQTGTYNAPLTYTATGN